MPQTTACSGCGHSSVVELGMTTKAGRRLSLLSCTRCQTRTWTADGQPVPREEVLRLTAGNPDFVVTPAPARARRKPAAER
ncbi:MAG: hypothetical protein EPN99_13180 [Frankiales bacterium]|nr:MAG: hypothetical protein EPN99_13180 [Frankiales bacterium]